MYYVREKDRPQRIIAALIGRVTGPGSDLALMNTRLNNWDFNAGGQAAFAVGEYNVLTMGGRLQATQRDGRNATQLYAGKGTINAGHIN